MKNKIIILLVVLLFSVGLAWAEDNATEDLKIEDSGNYILPISIADGVIKFDDGFEGFCLDLSKDSITTSDKFELGALKNSGDENNVKLAIIECYKQGKESDIGKIVKNLLSGNSNNEVLKEALNSNEKIGSQHVVNIDNTTEATFTFELLKSTDDSKSDVLAYKVSTKTVEQPEIIGASDDSDNDKKTDEPTDDKTTKEDTTDKTDDETVKDNATDEKTTEDTTDNKDTANKTEPKNKTTVNEKNETIVNKTNTVIVNENNTTIINNNNVKTINKTNATPENDTTSQLLKAAGNPIFILIIVIVIIAIVAVVMRRKD